MTEKETRSVQAEAFRRQTEEIAREKVAQSPKNLEALEVFRRRQNEIRCVLCDLTMPRLNGWETLTALRKLDPNLPVILASGYDKAQVMAGDHPELPQVFLCKPYKLNELGDAISQALVKEVKG